MLKKIGFILMSLVFVARVEAADPEITYDVLAIYSNNANAAYAGDPRVKIQSMINYMNTAHLNSGTGVKFRVVASANLDLGDSKLSLTNRGQALLDFMKNSDQVMALRNQFRPDFTVYVTGGLDVCGIGYMLANQSAFGAVSVIAYECTEDTLAHEIGHNMGAGHGARETALPNGNPYLYARGYGVDSLFADVMTYQWFYGLEFVTPIFSTPKLTCKGVPCGTDKDDAVRGFKNVAAKLANNSDCFPANKINGVWECKKLCPSTTNVNIGMTCNDSSCAESFGRTCYYNFGGSATWTSGGYVCQKPIMIACPVPVTPTTCGVNHLSFVGNYSTSTTSSKYIGGAIANINKVCGACGFRTDSTDRGITVNAYCL